MRDVADRHRRARSFGSILLAAVVVALGFRILTLAAADFLAERRPAIAALFEPSHAVALLARARGALAEDPPNHAAAAAAARNALRSEPLAPGALRILAQTEPENASALMPLAAVAARDLEAQVHLFELYVRNGAYERAIQRLDLIFRGQGRGILAPVADAIGKLITHSDFRAALEAALKAAPPWRTPLLAHLAQHGEDLDSVVALYDALISAGASLERNELRPYLSRLLKDGRDEDAYLAWLASLSPEQLADAGPLYNGQFQHEVTNTPFDWVLEDTPGALIDIHNEDERRILTVDFFGARVPFANVSHFLALPPGRHRFSGVERAQSLRNERGLQWRLSCLSRPKDPIGVTASLKGDVPWRPFELSFEVPENCPVQLLLLEIPARVALEREAAGGVAYAELKIERQ